MTNKLPKTSFCKKCGNYHTPTHPGNCNENLLPGTIFFDWEEYLKGKSYNGDKCDLTKYFPNGKKSTYALTNPDHAKKLIAQRLQELSRKLKNKIVDTATKYLDDGFPFSKGYYVIVYSKKHSFNWHDKELDNTHIKQLILTRILSNSYNVKGFVIPSSCVQCDKFRI